jgi:hypothetical protein
LQGKAGKCPECGARFRIPVREEAPALEWPGPPEQPAAASPAPPPAAAARAASAELIERLWNAAPPGRTLEIHLRDGTRLSPERFLKNASTSAYAVLVSREPDGTMTVSAVAWEAITRVVLGGLGELPPALADPPSSPAPLVPADRPR